MILLLKFTPLLKLITLEGKVDFKWHSMISQAHSSWRRSHAFGSKIGMYLAFYDFSLFFFYWKQIFIWISFASLTQSFVSKSWMNLTFYHYSNSLLLKTKGKLYRYLLVLKLITLEAGAEFICSPIASQIHYTKKAERKRKQIKRKWKKYFEHSNLPSRDW